MRMWLYPYLTWATVALIVFVLGYMLTDTEHGNRKILLLSLLVAALVIGASLIRQKMRPKSSERIENAESSENAENTSTEDAVAPW